MSEADPTTQPSTMSATPNEQLSQLVVTSLLEKSLILEGRKDEVLRKLLNGTAKESDWRMWAEDVLHAEEQANANN